MSIFKNGLFNTLIASSPIREIQQSAIRNKLNIVSSKNIFISSKSHKIEIFETNLYKKKVIFLPGWLGHKDSKYLLPLANLFYEKNFDIIRIHPIDHGNTEHLNKDFFRATDIEALTEVILHIGNKYSDNELHLIGFSLGGNIAIRISASFNINCLNTTVAISPVIDPEISMSAMDNGSWIIRKYFLNKWKKSLKRKIQVHEYNDLAQALNLKSMLEITSFFVKNYSPHNDINELFSGYAITQDTMDCIKHNTYIYSSIDDPCVPIGPLNKLKQTDFVRFKPQQYGGHCGFIDDFKFSSSIYEEIVNKLSNTKKTN